jgi:hypothetical protein
MNALSSDANKWIITDLNTAEDLCEFGTILPSSGGPIGHGQFGTYDGWDVYVEPFTHNEIIMGCKDGALGSGYCFAPYIPLVTLPSDATMFAQEKSFLMRYSKALRRDGRKYFTKVVFV